MSRFIESICWKDRDYLNLELHQARVDRTFRVFFSDKKAWKLEDILAPQNPGHWVKVRLLYGENDFTISNSIYEMKSISKLNLVDDDALSYDFKLQDRTAINRHLSNNADEDIIIIKNGMVTDASYANLLFWDGDDWVTPNTFLLNGVKRQSLLAKGLIKERTIAREQVYDFEKVSLINAMLDPGMTEISTNLIR